MMRLCSLLFLLSIDIQVEGRVSPYPVLLPAWPSSYAMNKSTIAMASNSAGFFNATLAAQFGIVAFDHNNAYALWYKHVVHGRMPKGSTSEEYLVEQCAFVKEASHNRTRCFVYRNGEVSLSWLSSEAQKMYTKSDSNLFLQSGGKPYNEPGDGDPHAHDPNKDQYFFNFSNVNMTPFWNDTIILGVHSVRPKSGPSQTRCCGNVVDGLFVDDTHGLGTEHNQMVKRCGMTPNEVADWNKKSLAAYTSSFQQVVGRGGFVWNLMRDPENNMAETYGAKPQPLNTTCKTWMLSKCGNTSWDGANWPLLMSPEPGSEEQSAAAFMLIRGPYAWWGRGWLGGDVDYHPTVAHMDPGEPTGACTVVNAAQGIFHRTYTKMNVTLNCPAWTATFDDI